MVNYLGWLQTPPLWVPQIFAKVDANFVPTAVLHSCFYFFPANENILFENYLNVVLLNFSGGTFIWEVCVKVVHYLSDAFFLMYI